MNRRDIIIVAALINAGLLIVLFVTGLKSDDTASEMASNPPAAETVFPVEMANQPFYSNSSIDIPLQTPQQIPQPVDPMASTAPIEMHSFATAPSTPSGTEAVSMNFADDLKVFSTPFESAPTNEFSALSVNQNASEHKQTQNVEVTVKKGDVLEKIARQHKTTVDAILKANNLSSVKLKIGQVLKVPSGQKSSANVTAKAATPSANADAKYYTVKNGDNPWTIAVKNRMKVEDLLKLNNLNEEKARKLKPGDKLRIQ